MADAVAALNAALADRYRLERELGRGGMATVYVAHDVRHDRQVAVKVLRPELSAAIGGERFLAEIRTTARLRHPNILPLFDSGDAGGALYYVMPLVQGESLHARLARDGTLPLDEALQVTREVADALTHAHAAGIVHRDIKPENILLEGGHALLTDFGIARAVDADGDVRLTATGLALGTPLYMSPEQSAGDPLVDGRSDLYSLAAVLFEMLAGRPPFVGKSPQAILLQRFTQPAPRVSTLRPDVPAAIDAAVDRALTRDPAERQPSVERFAASLVADATGARSAAADRSIAVLPFEDMSADRGEEYFGDGIAEEIINALTRLPGLRVVARTSSFSFKGRREDLRAVGEKLGVATVLEGSVRRAGNRLRITAQLISTADGYHLWSERYDREVADIFAVQDEIAAAIAEKMQLTYVRPERGDGTPATTRDVEAYEAYLKGRALLARRGVALIDALACFERAVALDPASAQSHAALAETLWMLAYYDFRPVADTIPRAREALRRAFELEPDLPEALGTSGNIAVTVDWDVAAARDFYERALRAKPQLSEVRVNYAIRVLATLHEAPDRVAAHFRRAMDDDPLSALTAAAAALGLTSVGRVEDAVASGQRAVDLDPTSFVGHMGLAWAVSIAGDHARALREAALAVQLSGRHPWPLAVTTRALAAAGETARAAAVHDELRARAVSGSVPAVWLAMSALALGRDEEAFEHAMRSVENRDRIGPWITTFPDIGGLKRHPRYPELLRKAGL